MMIDMCWAPNYASGTVAVSLMKLLIWLVVDFHCPLVTPTSERIMVFVNEINSGNIRCAECYPLKLMATHIPFTNGVFCFLLHPCSRFSTSILYLLYFTLSTWSHSTPIESTKTTSTNAQRRLQPYAL